MQARREGQLVVCDVVYAELVPVFGAKTELDEALRKLGASFDFISPAAAWYAGSVFCSYREAGGPREHLISDMLIAAHAKTQAERLAANDRGYLRRYFPRLSSFADRVDLSLSDIRREFHGQDFPPMRVVEVFTVGPLVSMRNRTLFRGLDLVPCRSAPDHQGSSNHQACVSDFVL